MHVESAVSPPRRYKSFLLVGKIQTFELFDLVSSFHQNTVHENTTPSRQLLYPDTALRDASHAGAPGWFLRVINEAVRGLESVVAYFHDAIGCDSGPPDKITSIRAFFERPHRFNI